MNYFETRTPTKTYSIRSLDNSYNGKPICPKCKLTKRTRAAEGILELGRTNVRIQHGEDHGRPADASQGVGFIVSGLGLYFWLVAMRSMPIPF